MGPFQTFTVIFPFVEFYIFHFDWLLLFLHNLSAFILLLCLAKWLPC